MKKRAKILPVYILLFLLAATVCLGLFFGTATADAETYGGDYRYEFESYDVTYDIAENSKIAVTEIIKVNYLGRNSTGLIRDIPSDAGAQVKNVKVEGVELISGGHDVPYEVKIESNDFISVDIGDYIGKYKQSETYKITYDYCIANTTINSGKLSLDPIGTGNACEIKSASVTLILPKGYIGGSAVRYVGAYGQDTEGDYDYTAEVQDGRTVIKTSCTDLPEYCGVTFDLSFEQGAIRPYFDFTPYWFVIALAALIVVIICVKLLFFNRYTLAPVVNFEAPDGMDPLIVGKLIDNKVNSQDVTALIFYWADKGYLKINLDDENNPTLIKIKNLPAMAPDYEQAVFAGLFRQGDSVSTNDLKYTFYRTFERATALANGHAQGLFMSSSIGVSIIFALLGGILTGLAPMLCGILFVAPSLIYFYGFIAIIPALLLYGFAESIMYNRLKNKKSRTALLIVLLALAILACSALFTLIIPGSLLPLVPKFLICLLSFTAVTSSVMIISRTREYTQKLNGVVGFRNFILLAEKDRLEALLESDPQYYYHVLPYAQVLNVSDKWQNKFKDITVAPPAWATMSSYDRMFDFILINNLIRHSAINITVGMVSRPSSSGANHGGGFGGFGGSFGGHSGGGFGGGGSRGR